MYYKDVHDILAEDSRFSWLLEQDYKIVSPEMAREVCQTLLNHDGVIAFDAETTGLHVNFLGVDEIVGLVFSRQEGESFYFPLRHNAIENVCAEDELDDFMVNLIKPILQQKSVVTFNGTFDSKTVFPWGIIVNIVGDVQLLYRLTYQHVERLQPNQLALECMADTYLGRSSLELSMFLPEELQGKKNSWELANFADLPYESVRLYACADTDNTLALYNQLMERHAVEEFGAKKTSQIEHSMMKVIAYNEYFGTHFDEGALPKLKADVAQQLEVWTNKLYEIVGYSFNPSSSKQLAQALFEDLGYPCKTFTDKGSPSTSQTVIKDLARDPEKYPAAPILLEIKQLQALQRTFIKQIEKDNQKEFVFASIDPLLETGRMSTSKPNIQGMAGFVKQYFTPRDGYYTFNFDFSSVEYRILASMSGEKDLIDFFQDPIRDYHRRQASVLFGIPYSQVTSKERKMAKPLNFGIPYGKGDPSLGADIFGTMSEENTRKAADLRERYFAGQPHVRQFFDTAKLEAQEQGWVQTYFGRRRYLDPVRLGGGDYNRGLGKAMRAAGNHKIQGTAADLYKIGMIRLYQEIVNRGWWGKVLLTAMVHDECNLEVHCSIDPKELLEVVLKSVMVDLPDWCPLYIGCGWGNNWYEAKSEDLNAGTQQLILQSPYTWDGNLEKWVAHCEELRKLYMANRVIEYINDPSTDHSSIDPDMLDFVSQLGYEWGTLLSSTYFANSVDTSMYSQFPQPSVADETTVVEPESTTPVADEPVIIYPDDGEPLDVISEVGSYMFWVDEEQHYELFILACPDVLSYIKKRGFYQQYDGLIQVGLLDLDNPDSCYDESAWIPVQMVGDIRRRAYEYLRGH